MPASPMPRAVAVRHAHDRADGLLLGNPSRRLRRVGSGGHALAAMRQRSAALRSAGRGRKRGSRGPRRGRPGGRTPSRAREGRRRYLAVRAHDGRAWPGPQLASASPASSRGPGRHRRLARRAIDRLARPGFACPEAAGRRRRLALRRVLGDGSRPPRRGGAGGHPIGPVRKRSAAHRSTGRGRSRGRRNARHRGPGRRAPPGSREGGRRSRALRRRRHR